MTPKLKLSENLVQRLLNVKDNKLGALYGLMYDGILLVVGMSVQIEDTSFQELQAHFPTEIDFCGIVAFSEKADDELSTRAIDNLQEVIVSDNPLLLKRVYGESNTLSACFYLNQKLVKVSYDTITESDICQLFVHIRLKTQLPFMCEPSSEAIFESINNLQKKVSSGTAAFHILGTGVYLFGTEMEDPSPSVGDLFKVALFNHTEGSGSQLKKQVDGCQSLQNVNVMNVSMMQKCTRDGQAETAGSKSAPVIHHIKCSSNGDSVERIRIVLPIDALCMVHFDRKVSELYNILVDSLCRSLRLVERNLSRNCQPPTMPHVYHFLPSNLNHFFSIVYSAVSDVELTSVREVFHKQLCLPNNRPVLRKGNAHVFKDAKETSTLLVNVHEGLQPSGVKDGELAVVQGNYSYHHYMQDKKNDNGWGCAYRSLQTLVSWFRWQGFIDVNVPTHEEIQKCLVDIGDKPPNFVGSSQWIGSTEVGYCLESMFGITCRVMCVSSGEELSEKGSELTMHFKTQGTPIMIGGGVLAHTILGVDYNRQTGDLRFLVLDPHYTGGEDLKIIQSKGWVGWKKLSFWDKNSFYNLCMPIRPLCI